MVWMPNEFTGAQPALGDAELLGIDDPSAMSAHERPYFRYTTASAQDATAAAGAAATAPNAEPYAMVKARESSPAHFAIRHSPVVSESAPAAAADSSRYNPDALRLLSETLAPLINASSSPGTSLSLTPASASSSSAGPNVVPSSHGGSAGGAVGEERVGENAFREGDSRQEGVLPSGMGVGVLKLTWSWEEWILGLGIGAAAIGFAVTLVTSATGARLGPGRNMSAVMAPAGSAVGGGAVSEAAASGSVLSGDLLAGGGGAAAAGKGDARGGSLNEGSMAPVMVLGEEQGVGVGGAQGKNVPFYLREAKPGVIELSATTLPHVLRLRPTLVMFYAPWCPYCQRMEGAWAALAEKLHQEGFNVQVARVDAYRYPELTDKYKIPGFPTLMLFNGERPMATHRGRRSLEALFTFVEKHF
ncbi:hypothetical protein CLOM_g16609 [Closterium sp. NIES-68]|nr:hypothetical protein CLOM_g16609 [Closterium sp. NIES-68]GJP57458.1 hypothetical protein CLOP_g57 [Closterium sp. NIES-67]